MNMNIFDTESNGFLENATKLHCLVIKNTETKQILRCVPSGIPAKADMTIEEGIKHLVADQKRGIPMVGHNAIKHDLPLMQKLYPWFEYDEKQVLDTLVLSRLIFSNLKETDEALVKTGRLAGKLWGSHSLKAWGYRTGNNKGDYADDYKARAGDSYQDGDEWLNFSVDMLEYCVQDTSTTESLLAFMKLDKYSPIAIELEHAVAFICARMERHGWMFDTKKAAKLYGDLAQERDAIKKQMSETFEPLVEIRISEKTGKRLKDKVTEFNPASRDQIAYRLTKKYGWKPTKFTDSGKAQVDEESLSKLDYPEAKLLARFFLLEKRIGMIAEGKTAWLALERNGRIHGAINTNGAVSGRCTHNHPNIAQVPSVASLYGKECRELYTVPKGKKQVGVDLAGVELRCLAHYMGAWDKGAYGEALLNGDIHSVNTAALFGIPLDKFLKGRKDDTLLVAVANDHEGAGKYLAGLNPGARKTATVSEYYNSLRSIGKTFIYGWLYGAGDAKIGSIVGEGAAVGKKLKERFMLSVPAIGKLKKAIDGRVKERNFLMGLDGRVLHCRSPHSALNLLLQSCGAILAKRWLVEVMLEAEKRGYVWGKDFAMLGFIHDETQWEVREDLAEEFGKMVEGCAIKAGEFFKFKIQIDAEAKVGDNWYETH